MGLLTLGCDGGDPTAKFWLSGIEWGYSKKEGNPEEYYRTTLVQEIEKGKYEPDGLYKWKDTLKISLWYKCRKTILCNNW